MPIQNQFKKQIKFHLSAEESALVRRLESIRSAIAELWRLDKQHLQDAATELRELSGLEFGANSNGVYTRRPSFKDDTDDVWGMFALWGPESSVWNTLDCLSVLADLSAEQFFVVLAQVEWELAVDNLLYLQYERASGKGRQQKSSVIEATCSATYAEWALGIARAKAMSHTTHP